MVWFPELTVLPLERYGALLSPEHLRRSLGRIAEARARLEGRAVWNVSSTAVGGGVAEMVRSLLAYARGAGIDARWAVIDGTPEFFRFSKRLHNAIHGNAGDGSPIGDAERHVFEQVNARNAAELVPMIRPGDIAIVHDPQPAGMIEALVACGADVVWRCHIGQDYVNAEVEQAWRFLAPYVRPAHAYVFSRAAYVRASGLDAARASVIPPTIDPFSAKNQALGERCVAAILDHIGVIQSDADDDPDPCMFRREDGSPGRVDRVATVLRDGPPPQQSTPLIVQVSRWDRLKDPLGVLLAYAQLPVERTAGAHLVLAGPAVGGVTDDPEGAGVLAAVIEEWRLLPADVRRRVHLVSLPTADVEENAAMVNALQRHAAVIAQKSLHEGFGLTVTEGMWKGRPVVASAVGGIQDQIEDGVSGLLIRDPRDLVAFGNALARLLADRALAMELGARGHGRVLEHYLGLDSLLRFAALIERLDETAAAFHARFARVAIS